MCLENRDVFVDIFLIYLFLLICLVIHLLGLFVLAALYNRDICVIVNLRFAFV